MSSFPSEGFSCIITIDQMFTIKLKWPTETKSSETSFHHWLNWGGGQVLRIIFNLLSFVGRLGDLTSSRSLLVHCFDDSHSYSLSLTNSQRRIVRELLNTQVFKEPFQPWQRHQISRLWGHLPVLYQNGDKCSPLA